MLQNRPRWQNNTWWVPSTSWDSGLILRRGSYFKKARTCRLIICMSLIKAQGWSRADRQICSTQSTSCRRRSGSQTKPSSLHFSWLNLNGFVRRVSSTQSWLCWKIIEALKYKLRSTWSLLISSWNKSTQCSLPSNGLRWPKRPQRNIRSTRHVKYRRLMSSSKWRRY